MKDLKPALKFFLYLSSYIIFLGNLHCVPNPESSPTPRKVEPIKEEVYISQGDPRELIKGAQMDPFLNINERELDTYGEVYHKISNYI